MYTHSNFCTFVDFKDGGYTKQHGNCSPEAINIKLSVSGVMLVLVSMRIPKVFILRILPFNHIQTFYASSFEARYLL